MPFYELVRRTGCGDEASEASLERLRSVPYETLLKVSNAMTREIVNGQLWEPCIGPAGSIVAQRASAIVESGVFLHLPYLAGTNLNEGTHLSRFARNRTCSNISEEDAVFEAFIRALVLDGRTISDKTLSKLKELYPPHDPDAGGPFHTADPVFNRASAWYTDEMYLAPRRRFFKHAAEKQPLYGYYFKEFLPGRDPEMGVAHGSELPLLLGPVPEGEGELSEKMRDFFINFVVDLHPGGAWTRYTPEHQNVLQLKKNDIKMIADDWDREKTDFLDSKCVLDDFEK